MKLRSGGRECDNIGRGNVAKSPWRRASLAQEASVWQIPFVTKPLSPDTTSEVAAMQFAAWRAMSAAAKLRQLHEMSLVIERLERAGVRHRNPAASEEELRHLVVEQRFARLTAAGADPRTFRGR